MIGFLQNIGDVLVVQSNFIEQLSSIQSVGESVAGVTANRTYTVEFRHSEDNSTWTAWQAWNLANAQAITYDPDATNYFQHRFTRTGSDGSGLLEIYAILIGYTINPNAVSGHGSFTDIGMLWEVQDFLKAVIKSRVIQYAGADKFAVLAFEERQTSGSPKNVILVANVRFDEATPSYSGSSDWPISCDLLVKMQGAPTSNEHREFQEMVGILMTVFRQDQNSQYRYSFTFKGVDFVNVALGELSIADFGIIQAGMVHDKKTDCNYMRLELNFTIFAERKILNYTE